MLLSMKIVTRGLLTTAVVAGLALSSGSALTAGPAYAQPPTSAGSSVRPTAQAGPRGQSDPATFTLVTYDVRADIDGHSLLTLTGNSATWYNIEFAAPGVHNGQDNPTIINSVSWYPTWPHPGENRDCHCHSSTFSGVAPPVPINAIAVSYTPVSCRDSCSATYSDGTIVIDFNDDPSGSDAWYEIQVTLWVPPPAI